MPKIATDANGIVTEGKYIGHHIDEVMEYLENLEEKVRSGEAPPQSAPSSGNPPSPQPPTPAAALEDAAQKRLQGMESLATAQALRAEQDDEAGFMHSVPDYEVYRSKIAEMKKGMPPAMRVTKGIHRQMYLFIKSQDPAVQARMMGGEPEAPPEGEESPAASTPLAPPPPPPSPSGPAPSAVPPRVQAPPSAPPPPTRREAPAPKKSRLKATPKIQRMAEAFGQSVDAYLADAEARGVTQEQLEEYSSGRAAGTRRSSIYG